jgi:hypothetical protein
MEQSITVSAVRTLTLTLWMLNSGVSILRCVVVDSAVSIKEKRSPKDRIFA